MNAKIKLLLGGCITVAIYMGFLLWEHHSDSKSFAPQAQTLRVEQHASYINLSYENLINQSDIILVGTLSEISPSKWNQDSGEYWSDDSNPRLATPVEFHMLKFNISKTIIDKIGINDQPTIDITVLGVSPLDGNADYSLAVGDNVVVFANKTELIWRGGQTKPIIEVATAPSFDFFIKSTKDGLFKGRAVRDLGKGNFATENVSLALPDLILQIQSITQKPIP